MAINLQAIIADHKKRLPYTAKNGLTIIDLKLSDENDQVIITYDDNSTAKVPAKIFILAEML